MPRNSLKLNPQQSHKQLLIAESELNRHLLIQECQEAVAGIRGLTEDVKRVGTLVSSLALLIEGFSTLRKKESQPAPKRGWISSIVEGARLGTSLWAAFRRK